MRSLITTRQIDQRSQTRNLEGLFPILMYIQPMNEVMLPRLLFQLGASFFQDDVSTSLGKEEDTEDPTKGSGTELNPVAARR
jgi:hypothetical protein